MKFTIPYPKTKSGMKEFCRLYGLNAIYSGKFWRRRKEDATQWHGIVRANLMQQRVPKKQFDKPVCIIFYWNDHLDCDNHAYIQKCIIDGLKGWVISDDSRKYVKQVTSKFHDKDFILIEVKEYGTAD